MLRRSNKQTVVIARNVYKSIFWELQRKTEILYRRISQKDGVVSVVVRIVTSVM